MIAATPDRYQHQAVPEHESPSTYISIPCVSKSVSEFFDVPYPNVLEAQLLFGFPSSRCRFTDNYIANFIFKVSNQGFQKFS
jgi:hypothetical protein